MPTAIEMCAGRPRALAGVKGDNDTEPTMPASGDAFSPDDQSRICTIWEQQREI